MALNIPHEHADDVHWFQFTTDFDALSFSEQTRYRSHMNQWQKARLEKTRTQQAQRKQQPIPQNMLFVAINGHVKALDSLSGKEIWSHFLPGQGMSILGGGKQFQQMSLIEQGEHLFVGHNGEVFCLHKVDGSVLWKNELPGAGYHNVTLSINGQTTKPG